MPPVIDSRSVTHPDLKTSITNSASAICESSKPSKDTTYPNVPKIRPIRMCQRYDLSECVKRADLLKIQLIRMCEGSKPSEDKTYPNVPKIRLIQMCESSKPSEDMTYPNV